MFVSVVSPQVRSKVTHQTGFGEVEGVTEGSSSASEPHVCPAGPRGLNWKVRQPGMLPSEGRRGQVDSPPPPLSSSSLGGRDDAARSGGSS